MKKIILIQAHKDLEYINDLIEELSDDNFIIYLHLDKKSKIDISSIHKNANLVRNRVDVGWGEFSQVQATLNSLYQIFSEQDQFSHVILLSGQDFPLQSNEKINVFLDQNSNNSYMQFFEIPDEGKFSNYQWRYNHYHFARKDLIKRKVYSLLIRLKLINKYNRSKLNNYKYYWGSQWWILTKAAIQEVLNCSTPKILNYFNYVFSSDEMYFQMLILNSNKNINVINDHKKFMIWEEFNHPKNLTLNDLDKIDFNNNLFCRKIENGISDVLKAKIKKMR